MRKRTLELLISPQSQFEIVGNLAIHWNFVTFKTVEHCICIFKKIKLKICTLILVISVSYFIFVCDNILHITIHYEHLVHILYTIKFITVSYLYTRKQVIIFYSVRL